MSQFRSYEEFFRELCKEEQYPPPRVIQPWLDKKPKYKLQVSAAKVEFSSQEVKGSSEIRKVSVVNVGYKPVRIKRIITTGPFYVSTSMSAKPLKQGETLRMSIIFRPNAVGFHTGKVFIQFQDDEPVSVEVLLVGQGVAAIE